MPKTPKELEIDINKLGEKTDRTFKEKDKHCEGVQLSYNQLLYGNGRPGLVSKIRVIQRDLAINLAASGFIIGLLIKIIFFTSKT